VLWGWEPTFKPIKQIQHERTVRFFNLQYTQIHANAHKE
jgi:hypothetical protein